MRLGTFFLKMRYFFKLEESRFRQSAELIRAQTLHLINIQLLPGDRIKSVKNLWPFPWDEERELEEVTPQQAEEQVRRLIQLHEKIHGKGT